MSAALDVRSPLPAVLEDLPLRVDREEVLRFQGYRKSVDVPDAAVLALFGEALALGELLIEPRVVYRAVDVTGQGPSTIEAGRERLHIPEIGRLWGPLEMIGAGICTIGAPIEERVRELWDRRELPLAVMLDSVGSAAVESLAEYANDALCQAAIAVGVKVTNRISPGYAGWDTAEQRSLFRLCPGGPIGVALNESCVMTPGKSMSFLVGVGPDARVDHSFTQCRRCWMADCAYRRVGVTMTGTMADNVILVGFMGAGKSSVGRILAKRLGRCFVETDEMITAREGRPIPEIFAGQGEAHFRALEDEAVRMLALKKGDVIATGGGLPCRDGRLEALRAIGTVVWLSGEFGALYERALRSGDRPMLHGKTREQAEALYEAREPFYSKADLAVDTTALNPDQVAAEILKVLRMGPSR